MPKGPQGQTRPADSIGLAVHVARIAIGEVDDDIRISGRVEGKAAGGDARAAKLAPEKRAQIAGKAAKARWHRQGADTVQTAKNETGTRREAVCMYPNNGLGEQKKEFSAAFSGFAMLRDRFRK